MELARGLGKRFWTRALLQPTMRLMPKQSVMRLQELGFPQFTTSAYGSFPARLVSGSARNRSQLEESLLAASKQASALAFNLARNESGRLD